MDFGVTNHLFASTCNLRKNFNKNHISLIIVGNGSLIPVTNMGHSILPTPHRPLHIHNIIVTLNIIKKNLIYVSKFITDNNCSVELDPFGLTVKDLRTHQILLCSDSTGDLYPVHDLESIPRMFVSLSPKAWHQRLGHPGNEVFCHLLSNNFISCNKIVSDVICNACQLGKHVILPFYSSNKVVNYSFDLIHSHIWTSPLPSLSGLKYYVIF